MNLDRAQIPMSLELDKKWHVGHRVSYRNFFTDTFPFLQTLLHVQYTYHHWFLVGFIAYYCPHYLVSHQLPGIVLIYSPKDFKTTAYAYLANIYALLISALISLLQSSLTQNDGVYVLVAVASPATLYLWACIFFKLLLFRKLPSWQGYGINTKTYKLMLFKQQKSGQGYEINIEIYKHSLQAVVIGSFFLWISMIYIIVASPGHISASQPACNKQFGLRGWITLVWPLPYLIQLLILLGSLNLPAPPFVPEYRRIFSCVIPCYQIVKR